MIKDLFNEIVRRMEWAKERKLQPEVRRTSVEFLCQIPIEEKVSYVVSIREMKEPGVLIRSLFPDGEPHYYVKMFEISVEEAASIVSTASLIVYGRVLRPDEGKNRLFA
jgi:hypothetical protein